MTLPTYLSGERIQGKTTDALVASTTLTESFASNTGWTTNNGSYQTWSASNDGTLTTTNSSHAYKAFAIGEPTTMVMDWDWKKTNSTPDSPFVILSSSTAGYGDPPAGHKRIILMINASQNTGLRISGRYNDGSLSEDNSADNTWLGTYNVKQYYRFKVSGGNFYLSIYGSAADRQAESSAIQTLSFTGYNAKYTSGTADFAYLDVGSYGAGGTSVIYNWNFWTGITNPATDKSKTALIISAAANATGVVGTSFNPNGAIDRFDFQDPAVNGTAATETVAYDVGATQGNAWTLRMKIKYTTLTSGDSEIDIGLSDTNHTAGGNGTQDYIGTRLIPANLVSTNALFRTRNVANGLPRAGADNTEWIPQTLNTTYYLQIQRTSSTAYNVKWGTNSGYTGDVRNYTNGSGTDNIDAGISGLRYIKIMNGETESYTNATGEITELKFWDSTTTSGTPTLQPSFLNSSNLPTGTRYEETDTRKIFRIKNGSWVEKGAA